MTNRSRGGRPPVEEHDRRDYTAAAAVTAEELDRVRTVAASTGLTVSAYTRRCLLSQRLPRTVVSDEYRVAWAALAPLARNANQLADAINRARVVGEPTRVHDAAALAAESPLLDALRDLRAQLLPTR